MTRTHALCRLLQHGPLSNQQVREITGWEHTQVERTLTSLHARREVRRIRVARSYVYELTDIARVPPLAP